MPALASQIVHGSLAQGYRGAGVYDEMIGRDGVIAGHWAGVLAGLDNLGPERRAQRVDRINTRVRETGIAHDLFADPSRSIQPWQLDLMPVVFTAADWRQIETAVIQRARILEAVLGDVYGEQVLLRQGLIPPRLVLADPSFLRPCKGIGFGTAWLQFLAVDLVRAPDGRWMVVDTHAETPAGIGYALANRTVLTHVSGDIFTASRGIRLAPYFQRMQEALAQRINRPDPSIALLSPGPHHDDFFSHAYLARYLGTLLVEGDDLRVDDGRIYLKTIDGLRPIDLVLRCVAAGFSDALELDPSGFLGPVGLVQAVRRQPNVVVNALGTAIVENRGLAAYLPALARSLLGEDLRFDDLEKRWLGDPEVRASVIGDIDRYFIRTAFERTARPGRAAPGRDPSRLSAQQRQALIEEIELEGDRLVAEVKVGLGTTPSFVGDRLEPKPYGVRVFASATADGYIVMPGGLAMTVDPGMSMALSAPDGASRDVWVVSEETQPAFKSLWLPAIEAAQVQRGPRELPSRAADNLFWLGRYVEDADWTFRLLRNCLARIEEDSGPRQSLQLSRLALVEQLEREQSSRVVVPQLLSPQQAISHLAGLLMTSSSHPYALPSLFNHIHRVASLSRDRLSLEAWRTLNTFYVGKRWQSREMPSSIGEQLDLIDTALGVIAAFNGLSHENMTRNYGWSLLDMGRRMSRAQNIAGVLLSAFPVEAADGDEVQSLLFVLELADSFITYRSRYRLDPMIELVLDLLIVDETNPRSLAFQLAAIAGQIDTLPQTGKGRGRTEVQRRVLELLTGVRLADVASLAQADDDGRRTALTALLKRQVEGIPLLSDAITRRYFSVTEKEPRWVRVRSRQVS